MKSSLALKFAPRLGLSTVLAILLSGCGQTGPLYMPKVPGKPQSTVTPATTVPGVAPATAPVPSTPPASQQ